MSIASVGSLGVGSSIALGNTLAFAPTATLEVGNVAVVAVALDNTGTTDGITSEITSITDTGGNTYTFLGAYRNGQQVAAFGAQIELWRVKCTGQLTTADTITVTFVNAITCKAASAWEFTVGAGKTLQVGGYTFSAVTEGPVDSLTLAGLSSLERLWFRVTATERRACAWEVTPTAPFTKITQGQADNGINNTSMVVNGEFYIATLSEVASFPQGTNTADHASVLAALEEVATGGIEGVLSKTLDAITISSAGAIEVQGTLSKTLSSVSIEATGTVEAQGVLSNTLAMVTLDATIAVEIQGVLNTTLDAITLVTSGTVLDGGTGDLTKTLDALVLQATAAIEVQGILTKSLDEIGFASESVVDVQAILTKTLDALALSMAGVVEVQGTLSKTLDAISITATAGVEVRFGDFSKTLDAFTLEATAFTDSPTWVSTTAPGTTWQSSYLHNVSQYGGVQPMGSGPYGGTIWTSPSQEPTEWESA